VAQLIVLDVNVLIAFFDPAHIHHQSAKDLFKSKRGEPKSVSVLTMAEFLVHPAMVGQLAQAQSKAKALGVQVVPLEPNEAADLALMRASTGLKAPDAVVAHLAMKLGAAIATFDANLAAKARAVGLALAAEFTT
jgi:predicted nucleic acid-binding protein